MDKFTKEQQVQAVYDLRVGYTLGHADIAMLKSMARQLLASMEQEPVAWLLSGGGAKNHVSFDGSNAYADPLREVTPLYAAPQLPQPAVAITQHFDTIALDTAKMVMCDVNRRDEFLGGDIQLLSRIQCRIDEACRAAMLQGADVSLTHEGNNHHEDNLGMVEPVTTAYKLPDDFICMLTGRAKYLREKGEIKSPELLERAAAAIQGESVNTPSIPNGWKLVPIDPTKDMLRAGQSVVGFWLNTVHCYSKMLAAAPAAPQQDVRLALEIGMSRYAGAMQKLVDSGD